MAKLKSVEDIRNKRDEIRESIRNLDLNKFKDQTYGSENEYTYKGMIAGIESILTDISTLTQYENRFIKLSTYNDRKKILQDLNNIHTYLGTPNNLYQYIDSLKKDLRGYNIRSFSENLIEFTQEIDEIRKLKLEIQNTLRQIEENKETIEESQQDSTETLVTLKDKLNLLDEKIEETTDKATKLESTNTELKNIRDQSQKILDSVQEDANEVESNKKLIESFAKNVEERNKKLTEIEQKTDENKNKLIEYEKERKNILKEANELIESAKNALNYKTAEGLSASFHSQYIEANDDGKLKSWIKGAAISLVLTLGLGVWILYNIQDEWFMVLGRILLLPIPIAAATFCAKQYSKQKNIIEDYAYKTTIAKAIVGFSEQLKKNGKDDDNSEYVEYIQKALGEIHKDPLRPRKEKKLENLSNSQFDQVITLAKKIVEFSKSTSTN